MDYVLVKYRHCASGTVGWFQMDRLDAKSLFNNIKSGVYWFCVVTAYEVYYYNHGRWASGLSLLKYC